MRLKANGLLCPHCASELKPVALACEPCSLEIRGDFSGEYANEFASLRGEELHFLRIFLQAEGKIKDMEAPLGMSYPTVRTRLTELKQKMKKLAPAKMPEAPAKKEAQFQYNSIVLSKVDAPRGEEYIFLDNNINSAVMKGFQINAGLFIKNFVNASKLEDFIIDHGSIKNCSMNGSHMDALRLHKARIWDSEFHGSKWSKCSLEEDSSIVDVKFHAVSIRHLNLQQESEIRNARMDGISVKELSLVRTRWVDFKFGGSRLVKKCSMENTKFISCKMKDVEFNNCSFSNVVCKNLQLQDQNIKNLDLRDCIIDGNAEFQKISGVML